MTVLAGDVGGTNTRLAIYPLGEDRRPAAEPLLQRVYPSSAHASLEIIVEAFLGTASAELGTRARFTGACVGVAGPVENNVCRATNLPWVIDARTLSQVLNVERVKLVNDLTAAARGVTAVGPKDLVLLGGGTPAEEGPIAVLGAGTGLGEAFLLWSPAARHYQVVPSEGGHVELAARTPLEHGLVQFLTVKYGRVSRERVLSGRGLVDVFSFLAAEPACRGLITPETVAMMASPGPGGPAAVVSERGMAGADPVCAMALSIFCSVLGAVAGDLALLVLATGGVYLVGGIAPRILGFLQRSGFRDAFERKGRLHTLVERIPAYVVTHPQVGLLGSAALAADKG